MGAMDRRKITLAHLRKMKEEGRVITMLTCYDYATAVLLQQAGIDSILVGDSLAQVVLGYQTTLQATMDIMIALTAAVRRGAPEVYLVGDMPFLSYQTSKEQALINAGRFLTEANCDCVKVEVDYRHLELVEAMAAAGIPVMAHLGLRPQSILQSGEYKAQSKTAEEAMKLVHDAEAMVQAGACGVLLECVCVNVAQAIAKKLPVPVIGCGSGPYCDGQVLVLHDILDLPGAGAAKFVKTFGHIGEEIRGAAIKYSQELRLKQYPNNEHGYHMNAEQQKRFDDMTGNVH